MTQSLLPTWCFEHCAMADGETAQWPHWFLLPGDEVTNRIYKGSPFMTESFLKTLLLNTTMLGLNF